MNDLENSPIGMWHVLRHRGETPGTTIYGLSFRFFEDRSEELPTALREIEQVRNQETVPSVDPSWPEPDLDQITEQAGKLESLSMLVIDDGNSIRAEARDSDWKLSSHGETYAAAEKIGGGESDIELHDLRDESFDVTLHIKDGILKVESGDPSNQPKVRYWDFDTLARVKNMEGSAFEWWEY